LYPNKIRSKAVALATSGNWAFNFALGYFVPIAFVTIKWKTYVIFGVFCLAMTIHVFFLPETAGKRLEDVTAMFEDPHGIKYIGTPAWKTRSATSRASRLEHEEGGMQSSDEDSSPERKEKYDENERKEHV
ncbi:high affinity glucose transporter, partial [Oleoguttula sp. CCFEE 5521]